MNVLRTLESRIAGLVEGTFGRVFRSEVRPMELAHRLVREMDEHRWTSVSRVYAPSDYVVWLSPEDHERYEGIEQEVIEELSAYLLEHARRENLVLATSPSISFETDDRLGLGEFGIETRLAAREEHDQEDRGAEELPEHGRTMIYSTSQRVRRPVQEAQARRGARALLLLDGRRLLVAPGGALIGRSRECDIVLDDTAASRRHAEVLPSGEGWRLVDLESTNGVRVNDRRVSGETLLDPGDRIEIGSTEMVFELR